MTGARAQYERLLAEARDLGHQGRMEAALVWLRAAARHAYLVHNGLWTDPGMEALIARLADRVIGGSGGAALDCRGGPVLFVASGLTGTGGHARSLGQWMEAARSLGHEARLMLTGGGTPPGYAGDCVSPGPCPTETGAMINAARALARIGPSQVVLFTSPFDVAAIGAVGHMKRRMGFRVIVFDHADHAFWCGTGVADLIASWRPIGAALARAARGYAGPIELVPLAAPHAPGPPVARRGQTLSLSVGAGWKIVPDGHWDYMRAVMRVLGENPGHRHTLLSTSSMPSGASTEAYVRRRLAGAPPDVSCRFELVLDEPASGPHYDRADFLIETLADAGSMVRVEAMARGLPVVMARNDACPVLSESGPEPDGYEALARTEDEVLALAGRMIADPGLRGRCRETLLGHHLRFHSPRVLAEAVGRALSPRAYGEAHGPGAHGHEPQCPIPLALLGRWDAHLHALDLASGGGMNPYLHMYSEERMSDPALGAMDTLRMLRGFGAADWAFIIRDALGVRS